MRELINVVQRATILADGHEITLDDLPRELTESVTLQPTEASSEIGSHARSMPRMGDRLDDIAKAHVLEVLERENGNKAKAARVLGIHRRKLYRLLERFEATEQPT